jgi:hypothetical protein
MLINDLQVDRKEAQTVALMCKRIYAVKLSQHKLPKLSPKKQGIGIFLGVCIALCRASISKLD